MSKNLYILNSIVQTVKDAGRQVSVMIYPSTWRAKAGRL